MANDTEKKLFPIDFYKNSITLTDLEINVKVNGIIKSLTTDYTLVDGTINKYVKFVEDLNVVFFFNHFFLPGRELSSRSEYAERMCVSYF